MRSDRKSEAARPAELRYCYEWPRPGVTVDIALFTVAGALNDLRLQVLLIERDEPPWRCMWALPGGFVRENEDLDAAALRELHEETGIPEARLEQVEAVGTPGRDTRGHVITVVYVGLAPAGRHQLAPRGDARAARWFDLAGVGAAAALGLRPRRVVAAGACATCAADWARRRSASTCCRRRSALSEMQALTEAILGRPLDRRNFRRKVLEAGFVAPAEGMRSRGGHRPAQLFRFVPEAFARRERPLPF